MSIQLVLLQLMGKMIRPRRRRRRFSLHFKQFHKEA